MGQTTTTVIRMPLANDFILLQLNDALFPIGSYTQSYGLETYVQKNLITHSESFFLYLKNYLHHNVLYNDLLAVKLAYEAGLDQQLHRIVQIEEIMSATKIAKEIREASKKIGSRFIKNCLALNLINDDTIFSDYQKCIKEEITDGHHAVAYAVFCSVLGLDIDRVLSNYLYAQLSAMINTGVKLIPLSQTEGQMLLTRLFYELEKIILALKPLTMMHLGQSSPGFELRAMQHANLYSRLYMS